jgi:hypothetical protein
MEGEPEMRIVIETIDHKDQRYDTVGDWQTDTPFTFCMQPAGNIAGVHCDLLIRVSRMKDWRSEALVAIHELVEALLCKHAGITAEQVDAWDMHSGDYCFGKPVKEGYPDEPGDSSRAPYHLQHLAAMIVEYILASHLSLDWGEHLANVDGCGEQRTSGKDPRLAAPYGKQRDVCDPKPFNPPPESAYANPGQIKAEEGE